MRSPLRILAFLSLVEDIWRKYPDMRFGQLLANVTGDEDTYNWENSQWREAFETYLAEHPPAVPLSVRPTGKGNA